MTTTDWLLMVLVIYLTTFLRNPEGASVGPGSKVSCQYTSIDDQVNKAVNNTEGDSDLIRLNDELSELFVLFDEYIQTNYNNNSLGLKNLKAVDIIRRLIDINATYTLTSFPSSCPPYKNAHGIYTVSVTGLQPFEVLCNSNLEGPGWTVIASRFSGDLNFFRNWEEYKRGFGNLTSEFFIGLEKLHAITAAQTHELYIYLEDFSGNKRYARYDNFLVGSESEKYVMAKLGVYSGNAGDALTRHDQKKFSTRDSDNDPSSSNCAIDRLGAWWYADCTDSNLFGVYLGGKFSSSMDMKGIIWNKWLGTQYSYKVVQMMVRPKCPCSYESS